LFGSKGWMMVHSKSVRSNRRRVIRGLQIKASMNQIQADWQTPFMSALPSSPEIARDDRDEGPTTEKIAGQRNSKKLIIYEGLARETTSI
jgi:hypothetical protein